MTIANENGARPSTASHETVHGPLVDLSASEVLPLREAMRDSS